MHDAEFFVPFPIFKGLSRGQIEKVLAVMIPRRFPVGECIIHEGTTGTSLYLLTEGKVRVTKKLTLEIEGLEAEEKQLASLSDQDRVAFGENGLVTAGKRTANVIAVSECELYELPGAEFEKLVASDLEIGYHMMRNTCIALAELLAGMDDNLLKFATALSIAVKM